MTEKEGLKQRTRCEYCGNLYYGIGTHQARCKAKRRWEKKLDKEGIIEEGKIVHVSGGLKVFMALGRTGEDEEDNRFRKNLETFEKKHGVHVDYNLDTDIIKIK